KQNPGQGEPIVSNRKIPRRRRRGMKGASRPGPAASRGAIGGGWLVAGVGQNEIVKLVLLVLGRVADGGEEAEEHVAELLRSDTVETLRLLAARLDEAGDAQQGQVMAHGGLALAEARAQVGYVQPAMFGERQEKENPGPGLVAEELEDLGEFAN